MNIIPRQWWGIFTALFKPRSDTMEKEMQIDFKLIKDAKVLKHFLEDRGKKHIAFYHYTNIETLQKMLKENGRRLFLTRMDKLNDAQEGKNASNKKKRMYVASFSFGKAESMAMWSMYGVPYKQGTRLTIPRRAITKILKNFEKNPTIYFAETGDPIFTKEKADLKMVDVIYAHPGSLEHNKEKILEDTEEKLIANLTGASELAFCIKNEIWLYENEVRMILEVGKILPGNVEKVAIDFGPAVDELEVTGSPCISKTELKRALKGLDGKKIHRSFAHNHVYFKNCRGCNKKTVFCKKNKKDAEK